MSRWSSWRAGEAEQPNAALLKALVGVCVGKDDGYVIGDAPDLGTGGWTAHAADRKHKPPRRRGAAEHAASDL